MNSNRYSDVNLSEDDIQAGLVYDWGSNYIEKFDTKFLDINTCNLICQDVYRSFGIREKSIPEIIPTYRENSSYFRPAENKIYIDEEQRFRPILLHEIAHGLIFHYFGLRKVAHGKEFVGFYMLLLHKWSKIPLNELIRTAKLNNVEYVFKKYPKSNYRAKPSLTNQIRHGIIELPKSKLPGLTVVRAKSTGGYEYVYYHDYDNMVDA
jgi:hypothetical protein